MKTCKSIFLMLAVLAAGTSCMQTPELEFGLDADQFAVGPAGGVLKVDISSSDRWYATTESPWLTVSPANGRGSVNCSIIVDSTILFAEREAVVYINNQDDASKNLELKVRQQGFPHMITVDKAKREVDDYDRLESRKFDVKISSNVEYDIVIPDTVTWLKVKEVPEFKPDRGSRPRNSIVTFEWDINTSDTLGRNVEVAFVAKSPGESLDKPASLNVTQKATVAIRPNSVEGDSLALISIGRALGAAEWDTSEKMEHWKNVDIWHEGENKGRVRSASFFIFRTKEEIPFAVQYLTAAEKLSFYGNSNTFMIDSLDCGEHITKLPNLKRLTIGAYGLSALPESFAALKSLEYLNLEGNNFQKIPAVLTQENFPNMKTLIFNSCKRYSIHDLSNDNRVDIGGFVDEPEFPVNLLKWSSLDTLRLSVNYLQGNLPDMKDAGLGEWTFEELKDSLGTDVTELPEALVGMPRVLPDTKLFAVNFNRLTGDIPQWLMYHPNLDYWAPFSLIFQQEGKTEDGINAGFGNEPPSLDYYYEVYRRKKFSPYRAK